jgi:hypothetical protein
MAKMTVTKCNFGKLFDMVAHRVWVIQKGAINRHPIGVVSMTDIMRVLAPKS